MAETLSSSVPGIYTALHKLVKEAADEISPEVAVFTYELQEYEPKRYVILSKIHGPRYEWESIGGTGFYAVYERYEIAGKVAVFSGEGAQENPLVPIEVLQEAFGVFQQTVMTPVITHRNQPFLEEVQPKGVTTFLMELQDFDYDSGVGSIGGGQGGWEGILDWQIHFEAKVASEPA